MKTKNQNAGSDCEPKGKGNARKYQKMWGELKTAIGILETVNIEKIPEAVDAEIYENRLYGIRRVKEKLSALEVIYNV